ncbi:MAG: acetyl-CoA carboxylase, biotin carboxyl carrier protein [Gammaproteobacteria bacterium]|nr:acetyl-CoA carboxylase, biotin carboxyl carrier protein [Gammaproteobacteria bacterium]|tara:strand:+ start:415 stop:861 length:447 start_codon:yes stop_codon:yes gene_type:complete
MDLRKIKKLMELLEESGLAEIEVKEGEESIKLSRTGSAKSTQKDRYVSENVFQPNKPIESPRDNIGDTSSNEKTINSPMIGTFYRAASPESKVFVEEGQKVKAGETVCILEAMKMMNQVTADTDCMIKKILVENAEPVEYGQPLFIIE